jgi:hypothetical protein
MKRKYIEEDIFKTGFWLILDCSKEQFIKSINKRHNIDEKDDTEFDGVHMKIEQDGVLYDYIWIEDKKDIPVLAHELIHFMYYELDSVGIKLTKDTNEVYAYYYQAILSKCLEVLNK